MPKPKASEWEEPPIQCKECDEKAHLCTVHGVGKPDRNNYTPPARTSIKINKGNVKL